MSRSFIALCLLLCAVSTPAMAASTPPAAAAPVAIPPLTQAQSIQVTVRSIVYESAAIPGQQASSDTLHVQILRPDKVRIVDVAASGAGRPTGSPDAPLYMFVSDGTTQYDYSATGMSYHKQPASPITGGVILSREDLSSLVQLPLVLGRTHGDYSLVGTEVQGGRAMHLYQGTAQEGGLSLVLKLWVDEKTHLPARFSKFVDAHGQANETYRAEFSDWLLNATLPATTFAWTPPPGAHPSTEVPQSAPPSAGAPAAPTPPALAP